MNRRSDHPEPPAATDPLRPWLLAAATALLVCRPLFPSEAPAALGEGLPVVMLWLALAVVWLLGLLGRPAVPIRWRWVDTLVLLLMALYSVAAVRGALCGAPRPAVNALWEWIGLTTSYFVVRQLVAGRREARAIVAVMIGLALALSVYGLYQVVDELPATRALYAQDPDAALRAAGVWYAPDSPQRLLFEKRLASTEPLATFALTNSLAGFLAPWLIVLLGIALYAWPRTRRDPRRWLILIVIALPVVACLALTRSRSAYVATALGLLTMLLLRVCGSPGPHVGGTAGLSSSVARPRFRWLLILAGVAMLAIGLVLTVRSCPDLLTRARTSFAYRLEYWQASMKIIGDDLLLGCGPGNFQNAYTRYKLPEASEEVSDPHNFLIEIWATAGTPAMLALLAILVGFFAMAWSDVRVAQPPSAVPGDSPQPEAAAQPRAAVPHAPVEYPWAVAVGGVLGMPLAVLASIASGVAPGVMVLAAGVVLIVVSFLLAWPWIDRGALPAGLPALGVAVLAVHLLASGGITFAAVAGSFWLLLAVGMVANRHDRVWNVSRGGLAAALAPWGLFAVLCYLTAYRPVLQAAAGWQRARNDPKSARAALEEAAVADPWSDTVRLQLAQLWFTRWRAGGQADAYQHFQENLDQALRLNPNDSSPWLLAGDWYLEACQQAGRKDAMEPAVDAYRRAAELYPNSALIHAKLAQSLHLAGKVEPGRAEAQEALRLDRLTPHEDKKLPAELRRAMESAIAPN